MCLDCGLCCDGTLFECAELEPHEEALFDGATLIRAGGKVALPLLCCHYQAGACSVYTQRPTTCSRFTCELYDSVAASHVDVSAAHERIAEIRRLCALLEGLLDWPPRSFTTARFRRWLTEFPGGETHARRAHPEALLKYGLLRVSLNRHFIPLASG